MITEPKSQGQSPDLQTIVIETEMIRLGQFLKMAALVSTGGEAKLRIQQGEVKVNGVVENQRGKQLRDGFVVEIGGKAYRISSTAAACSEKAGQQNP
ncbi:RNA-binding S4 domain-containing protein [Desulfurivibrio sp. D14AmB]|uniref:RNA-binding S4 domain-containing protein n=1 Tax=Desulfurivibrio sp. D14AmB TaxID=3374370 RepID=UPI00376EA83E